MHLYLSGTSPTNSLFTNDDGQVVFKVETSIIAGTSTISCVLPNDIPRRDDDVADTHERFGHLAQIKHNIATSSILYFGGKEIETKDYFRKDGWGSHGRNRVFTGPDGREYKWLLKPRTSHLVLNNDAKTPIARFHRRKLGIVQKARPASLEIFPDGEQMVETILITFVYIEKKRRAREG